MGKNQFAKLDIIPNRDELTKLVGDLQYAKLNVDELPIVIIENGLTKKFNSAILTASGSTSGICISCVGLRLDKGNTVIDEHPFVFYYDNEDKNKCFGGIIHHGNWNERTNVLEKWQIDAITASGLTANFTYKGIPTGTSGSLSDLYSNKMLSGITKQFEVLLANDPGKK